MSQEKMNKQEMEEKVPRQRVGAFARLDLKRLLDEYNWLVNKSEDVHWDVEYDDRDERITASGLLSIPISFVYEMGEIDNDTVADDLEISQVFYAGRKVYDTHEGTEKADPLDTIDTTAAQVQAFGRANII